MRNLYGNGQLNNALHKYGGIMKAKPKEENHIPT